MNKGYGVQVTAASQRDGRRTTAPVLVIATDEQDAALLAAEAAGPDATAEVLRELTKEEILEHDLDLEQLGTMKSLAVLNF
ncbi:hypothetical protein [Methylobacterium nigriterrae]|uniref:hypothetical protein n=1 Tax=Methylobacterium nigriterrae TaxID=3127512 RepID=UPI00301414BD